MVTAGHSWSLLVTAAFSSSHCSPEVVLGRQVHPTQQHQPEDEEADHADAHHKMEVRPLRLLAFVLAAAAATAAAAGVNAAAIAMALVGDDDRGRARVVAASQRVLLGRGHDREVGHFVRVAVAVAGRGAGVARVAGHGGRLLQGLVGRAGSAQHGEICKKKKEGFIFW